MPPSGHLKRDPLPGIEFQESPIVTLRVGPEKTAFYIHKNVLCNGSKVFKATFEGPFREASEQSVSMPEDNVEAVDRMIRWLYTGKFEVTRPITRKNALEVHWRLAHLNTLAEKYDLVQLRNDIVDVLFELRSLSTPAAAPNLDIVNYIYANTMKRSTFRKLIVQWFVWHIDLGWYAQNETASILAERGEFAADLVAGMAYRIRNPTKISVLDMDKTLLYEYEENTPDDSSVNGIRSN